MRFTPVTFTAKLLAISAIISVSATANNSNTSTPASYSATGKAPGKPLGKTMTQRPNILLITADDMNWDAVGAYGCPVEGTTPNIDTLASEGMKFDNAHVTIAVCQPSRSTLLTGRYPHRSGGEGFYHLQKAGVPILPQILKDNGYRTGILGKVEHSTPYGSYKWDMVKDFDDLGYGRSPTEYSRYASQYFQEAAKTGQPFFLMLNSHDPHRPFYGNDKKEWYKEGNGPVAEIPSRVFTEEEIVTPGFLEDLPEVRKEVSEYYSSVRRCDDTVGAVLKDLEESGLADNTIVVFLSDNGMAFPFAKTNCYLNSTKTPWMMRWPGVIEAGSTEKDHLIAGIDLTPTLLDAASIPAPEGMDGKSFLPLLKGQELEGHDQVFTQFHQTSGRKNFPMRGIQNMHYGYIYNPWSNGKRKFKNESMHGRTMKAMVEAAENDPQVAERVELFIHRVPEEFYDLKEDPNCRNNLINNPKYKAQIEQMRAEMEEWMIATKDPALVAFQNRNSPETVEEFVKTPLPAKKK